MTAEALEIQKPEPSPEVTPEPTPEVPQEVPEEQHPAEVEAAAVTFLTGFDSAFCPVPVPGEQEFEVVSFYIGGSSAFHVWDAQERALIKGRVTLPIWVPTPGLDNPTQVAQGIAHTMRSLGIPSGATPYRAVMWDMETSTDAEWLTLACNRLASLGYDSYIYGSASSVLQLPQRSGYIVADPTGHVHLYDHAGVVGTQYAWDVQVTGGQVDADVYLTSIRPHLSILP